MQLKKKPIENFYKFVSLVPNIYCTCLFLNPSPRLKQRLSQKVAWVVFLDGGDGFQRCDHKWHNSSSTDVASISLDLKVSIEGAHVIFTGKMLHI